MSQQSNAIAKVGLIPATIETVPVQICFNPSQRRNLSWTKWVIGGATLAGLALSLLTGGKAEAVSFTFETIADTSTSAPGGTGTFDFFFDAPSLDNGDVAFNGLSTEREGIYTSIDGTLNVVANENTPVPGSTDTFINFGYLSLSDGSVAFSASSSSAVDGIYSNVNGSLNTVVDTNTAVPGSTGTFDLVDNPSIDSGDVAFGGYDQNFTGTGIYTNAGGKLNVVVNQNTPVPGDPGVTFGAFSTPSLSNGDITFEGDTVAAVEPPDVPYGLGVYTSINGELNIVANKNTPIPNGTGTFAAFYGSLLDDEDVAFQGYGSFSESQGFVQPGIYTSIDGELSLVADTKTLIPGSGDTFGYFDPRLSLDDGYVAFKGRPSRLSQSEGIYTNLGGSLSKVIAVGDRLDDKTIALLDFGQEGLSENQIAFTATFNDGSQGIYIATVPEPTSVLGTFAFGMFGAGWMLRRRNRQVGELLQKKCSASKIEKMTSDASLRAS